MASSSNFITYIPQKNLKITDKYLDNQRDKKYIKGIIKYFNDRGISIRFTFTNPMIEEKHLNDQFCNSLLYYANNPLNGCIVYSPLLEEYIRRNFPDYKITSSTCKRITDVASLTGELEKDYYLVVIDYDQCHLVNKS